MNIDNYLETLTDEEKAKLENSILLCHRQLDEETLESVMDTLSILIKFKAKIEVIISCLLLKIVEKNSDYDYLDLPDEDEMIIEIINRALELNDAAIINGVNDLDQNSIIDFSAFFIRLSEQFSKLQSPTISEDEKVKRANNILKFYRPISKKMKLNYINSRLEDLCLYYINPEIYNMIYQQMNGNVDEQVIILDKIKQEIEELLTEHQMDFEIKSRVKNYYSIYEKMLSGKNLDEIFDILALRIISSDTEHCYQILSLLQQKYIEIPNRLKDYIANPKENDYQSLHTTMYDENGNIFEIQIRNFQMDKVAEEGSASHMKYKEISEMKNIGKSIRRDQNNNLVFVLKK